MRPVEAALRAVGSDPDDRAAARFALRLDVEGYAESGATKARIYNISETGLLLETDANLSVGEAIYVDLPEAAATAAVVVWNDRQFFGCEFRQDLSSGAVSAALLKSPYDPLPLPEFPLSAVDQLADDEEQTARAAIVLAVSLTLSLAALGILVAALTRL